MEKHYDYIVADGGKPCLIDRRGNVLMEPKTDVDVLYYPSHGMSLVKKDGRYGYINETGNLAIPFKFKKAFPFSENGYAFVVNDLDSGGYINRNGQYVISPIYDSGSKFQFGIAAVSKNGRYKFIYENGCKAIRGEFKYAGGFSRCGLAKYERLNGKQGFLDTRSFTIVELKEGCELFEFKEDSRVTKFKTGNREAIIDASGRVITGFFEKVIISPYSSLNPFLRNGLWGYVDDLGNEVIPNVYYEVTEFNEEGVAKVKAFHPLAENLVREFYINEEDEILDEEVVQQYNRDLISKFSKRCDFKKAMALAIRKV